MEKSWGIIDEFEWTYMEKPFLFINGNAWNNNAHMDPNGDSLLLGWIAMSGCAALFQQGLR